MFKNVLLVIVFLLTLVIVVLVEAVVHEAAAEDEGGEGVEVGHQDDGLNKFRQVPLWPTVTLGQRL